MSALPERYQRYAPPGQQLYVRPAEIELYDETDPIVHVPDPYDPNRSVAVRRSQLQPAVQPVPRDLTPQPLIDPLTQRFIGAGVGIGAAGAGVGWGAGQMFAGVAMMGTSGLLLLFGLLLAAGGLRASRTTVRIHQEVHQHARFGKNEVTM
jgi:hypothetical protein